jgi:hypothetical protein
MADQKISAMPSATVPLTGAELIPLVQGGVNVSSTLALFNDYAISQVSNYGAYQDLDGAQKPAADTVTQLRVNTVDFEQGVTKAVGSNQIYFDVTGVYSVIISLQCSNASANYDMLTFWPRINGVNVINSASSTGVSEKKGSINGRTVVACQYTLQFTAGQYLDFAFYTDSGDASIITLPASLVAPIHPAAAGVILSVIQVA